jgi:hypothetical protein
MANGAMGQDPRQQAATEPNSQRMQRRLQYLQRTRPNDPAVKRLQARLRGMPDYQAPDFQTLSPEQQAQQIAGTSGSVYEQMAGYAGQFDPATMQSQYSPIYSQEMERARQNVMGQFERQMAPEFQRQQEQFQQMAAERGLDPNSVAYKTQLQQLNERQDAARQQAMSQAETAAQGVQQSMFSQAGQMAMMPGQIAGQFADPYKLGFSQLLQQQKMAFEARQAELDRQNRLQIARTQGSANQGPTPYDRYIAETIEGGYGGGQQPNPFAGFAGGFAGGFGQGYLGGSK